MAAKSEVISSIECNQLEPAPSAHFSARWRDLAEIAVVFGFILAAVWTPQGKLNAFFSLTAAACVVGLAATGNWGISQFGLMRPTQGAGLVLLLGALLCMAVALIGIPLRSFGPGWLVPMHRAWQYVVWALAQEFILQGIFFVRLESILGSRRAVLVSAALFATAHFPSLLLTALSFCGGLVFCEFFPRWRNLYPIGIIHGALGLTIAASLPDHWLHHMRVGIGYLTVHS